MKVSGLPFFMNDCSCYTISLLNPKSSVQKYYRKLSERCIAQESHSHRSPVWWQFLQGYKITWTLWTHTRSHTRLSVSALWMTRRFLRWQIQGLQSWCPCRPVCRSCAPASSLWFRPWLRPPSSSSGPPPTGSHTARPRRWAEECQPGKTPRYSRPDGLSGTLGTESQTDDKVSSIKSINSLAIWTHECLSETRSSAFEKALRDICVLLHVLKSVKLRLKIGSCGCHYW